MSAPETPRDPRVSAAFGELGAEHGEPAGDWQAKVWSRIAREPQERRTRRLLRLFQVTSAVLAVAVVALSIFAYRTGQVADTKEREAKQALTAYQERVESVQRDIDEAIAAKEQAFQVLLNSKNERDKQAARELLEVSEKELKAKRYKLKELRKSEARREATRREKAKRVNVKCDPSDPLCGL